MSELKPPFDVLRAYDRGSGRGSLLPIDETVAAASTSPTQRKAVEEQLLSALGAGVPAVAADYICAKLVLIGSEASVPQLAKLLAQPATAEAARTALEAIPGQAVRRVLEQAIDRAGPDVRAGIIATLGARREEGSVKLLGRLLHDSRPGVPEAAAAALGDIGSPAAGKALKALRAKTPEEFQQVALDAALRCAGALRAHGHVAEARSLYRILADSSLPAHVWQPAAKALMSPARG